MPPVIGLDSDDEIQIAAIPRKRNQLRGVGGLRQINRTKRRTNIGTPLPGAAATSSSSSAPGRPPTPDCVYMPSGRTKDDSRQPQTQSQGSFIDLVSSDEEVEDVKPVITRLMLAQQKVNKIISAECVTQRVEIKALFLLNKTLFRTRTRNRS